MFQPHEWRNVSKKQVDDMLQSHKSLLARARTNPQFVSSPGDIVHHKNMIETLESLRPHCKGKAHP